jgi:hypothetical protein
LLICSNLVAGCRPSEVLILPALCGTASAGALNHHTQIS